MTYRLTSDDLITAASERCGWSRVRLPASAGQCTVDRLPLLDGVTLAYTDYLPSRDIVEESHIDRETPMLAITIGLDGCSGYMGGDDARFRFEAGHSTITAFRCVDGERRYRGDQHVRQWRLLVDAAAVRRHGIGTSAIETSDGQVRLLQFGKVRPALSSLVRKLEDKASPDGPHLLDMQITALQLLLEHAGVLGGAPSSARTGWSRADERKLHQARQMIEEAYADPLTIADLSRLVGLNAFKLKKGFRDLFQSSPSRMLTEIRMRHARVRLARGEPVSVVAYQCGYRHPGNFSAAFSRFFGTAPKNLMGRA